MEQTPSARGYAQLRTRQTCRSPDRLAVPFPIYRCHSGRGVLPRPVLVGHRRRKESDMAANADTFDGDKTITARDRLEAVLMAERNRSAIVECPEILPPGAKTLLELNAQLLMRIAT